MKLRGSHLVSILALAGLLGGFAPSPAIAADACDANVDVMPDGLKNGLNCGNSTDCKRMAVWIQDKARTYQGKVTAACGRINTAMANVKNVDQTSSQGSAKAHYSDSASSMKSLVAESDRLRAETASRTSSTLNSKRSSDPPAVNEARSLFSNPATFDGAELSDDRNPFRNSTTLHNDSPLLKNSAEFIHKLKKDRDRRAEAQQSLENVADRADKNKENGATAKEEGKGMDPSSLMGPLAALAGMANQKKDQGAESGLSETPTAATPAEAKIADSTIKGISRTGDGKKAAPGAGSGKTSGAEAAKEEATKTGAQYGSSLSANSPYQDAFTGIGANGTGGSSSPTTSGGGGGGSAGTDGVERDLASAEKHSAAEDEALQNFGGGLNFGGASSHSSSPSSPTPDEGVKDFLQNAENSMADGSFGETPADGEFAAGAGVEGEDGLELFRRVRSALERSQRKGAILSGLSGPKDPRYR